jgi:hypothetical protein
VGAADTYISQQRFFGWRKIAQLKELSAAYVDLDYQRTSLAGHSAEAVAEAVLARLEHHTLPTPWLIGTGRGLLALWPHGAVPRAALPRWQAVQAHLAKTLHGFGADKRALDAARVFRLVGSRNSRNWQPVRLIHQPSTERWDFDDLAHEVLPVSRDELVSLRAERAKRRANRQSAPGPQKRLTAASLWETRLTDLQKLRHHRWFGPLPPGTRDTWLFLAATAMSWLSPPAVLRREVFALAQEVGGWDEREAKQRFATVLDRAHRAARGETVSWRGHNVDPRYRFKAETIVEWLEIEPAEMRQANLRSLITPDIDRERKRQRMRQHREGTDRGTYRQAQRDVSLKEQRPWDRLGMSRRTWYRRGKPEP